MAEYVRMGPAGPERVPRPVQRGEYVRLSAAHAEALRPEPNPLQRMVDDLVRRYDPGGYQLQCPVSGCGWHLLVPRMELDPVGDVDYDGSGYLVYAEGVPREDVELVLRTHVDWHAVLSETGAENVSLPLEPAP
jgi:hypothetical protein